MIFNKKYEYEPIKKKSKKKIIITIILFICFLLLLGYSAFNIINYILENKRTNDALKDVSEITKLSEVKDNNSDNNSNIKKYNIDYELLKKTNNDFVGYLIVPGTNISQTVVKGLDNEYYLKHNFYKNYDIAGWLFSDFENKMDGTDKNIVIYGHNMKTGTMFGSLKNVLTDEWFNSIDNRYITFIREYEEETYEIFSAYIIKSEDYYRKVSFSEEQFKDFLSTITLRSYKNFNVKVFETDKILTLSTCHSDNRYRLVVHAKKIIK